MSAPGGLARRGVAVQEPTRPLQAVSRLIELAAGTTLSEDPPFCGSDNAANIVDMFPHSCEEQVMVTDILQDMGCDLSDGSLTAAQRDLERWELKISRKACQSRRTFATILPSVASCTP